MSIVLLTALQVRGDIVKFAEAVKKGDEASVRKMLADGIDPNTRIPESRLNKTPLFPAVKLPETTITKILLKAGADPFLEDGNGDPVMVHAADAKTIEHARVLLRHGVSIDSQNRAGLTPLLRGAPYENRADLKVKIDLGADMNLTDPQGNTALMSASRVANHEAMKLLIEARANLDLVNDGIHDRKGRPAQILHGIAGASRRAWEQRSCPLP